MPGEPLIFVEVALMDTVADSIQALLDDTKPELDPRKAKTAIFYSISSTQEGLRGISFGHFLIKRVVDDLSRTFPKLKHFVTLSPIPDFRKWLEGQLAKGESGLLTAKDQSDLKAIAGSASPRKVAELLSTPGWFRNLPVAQVLKAPLMDLCARYLIEEQRDSRPIDPVARFHLGNGARIERLNWLGDTSKRGLGESVGMMVNYGYQLDEIEKNHEAYTETGKIIVSPQVRRLVKAHS